jgi:hypothetical protein
MCPSFLKLHPYTIKNKEVADSRIAASSIGGNSLTSMEPNTKLLPQQQTQKSRRI